MRSETSRSTAPGPPREAEITVLAAARGALRAGVRVFTLGRWMARRPAIVGDEIAVTARLLDQLPVAPAVVVAVAPDVAVQSCVDELLPGVRGMLGTFGTLTVNVACPGPTVPELAGVLAMYNQPADALPEALVEAVAAGRRCGLTTAGGNCVLLLQQFVPAASSAVVHASPYRTTPVHVDGRWGLTERWSAADEFVVDAAGVRETLAWKPTASVAAAGGTHTVAMPDGLRRQGSLSRDTVRHLAAMAKDAAVTAGRRLALDIALGEHGPVVLRCRPSPVGRMSRTGTDA